MNNATAARSKWEQQIHVAAAVSHAFEEKGVSTILVGGAVVAYYTSGEYTTADVDMIPAPLRKEEIEATMKRLGFERFEDYRHWCKEIICFLTCRSERRVLSCSPYA